MAKLIDLWSRISSWRSSKNKVQKLKLMTKQPLSEEKSSEVKIEPITKMSHEPVIRDLFEAINIMVNQIVDMARENAKQAFVVEHVTMAIEELSMAALKTAEASGNAFTFAEAAREKAELGYATVSEMNSVMGLLTTSQRKIGEIGGLIGSIAKESKLIAINAMLEAARAGEMGRGFMVVAKKTQELSGNVTQHLNSIETVIHESQDYADLNQEKASLVSSSLEVIREGSSVTSDSMKALNATIAGQSKTLSELSHMTVGVKTRVQEISIKLETATETLSQTLRDLREKLGITVESKSGDHFDFSETNHLSEQASEKKSAANGFDEF